MTRTMRDVGRERLGRRHTGDPACARPARLHHVNVGELDLVVLTPPQRARRDLLPVRRPGGRAAIVAGGTERLSPSPRADREDHASPAEPAALEHDPRAVAGPVRVAVIDTFGTRKHSIARAFCVDDRQAPMVPECLTKHDRAVLSGHGCMGQHGATPATVMHTRATTPTRARVGFFQVLFIANLHERCYRRPAKAPNSSRGGVSRATCRKHFTPATEPLRSLKSRAQLMPKTSGNRLTSSGKPGGMPGRTPNPAWLLPFVVAGRYALPPLGMKFASRRSPVPSRYAPWLNQAASEDPKARAAARAFVLVRSGQISSRTSPSSAATRCSLTCSRRLAVSNSWT